MFHLDNCKQGDFFNNTSVSSPRFALPKYRVANCKLFISLVTVRIHIQYIYKYLLGIDCLFEYLVAKLVPPRRNP